MYGDEACRAVGAAGGDWKGSGVSAEQFAETEGLSAGTLRWWSWRLGAEDRRAKSPDVAGLRQQSAAVSLVQVVRRNAPRAVGGVASESPVELVLGDVVVRERCGFDAETLGRVLEILEGEQLEPC